MKPHVMRKNFNGSEHREKYKIKSNTFWLNVYKTYNYVNFIFKFSIINIFYLKTMLQFDFLTL